MPDMKMLYHDLVRFETELWATIDARLREECGLQLTWLEIMRLLQSEPGLRVLDLAKEFVISVGGTSKVVDRIEAAGFCRRLPNPRDRRSALLELTESGEAMLLDAVPVFEDELDRRFRSVLGDDELERMILSLRLLRAGALPSSARPIP